MENEENVYGFKEEDFLEITDNSRTDLIRGDICKVLIAYRGVLFIQVVLGKEAGKVGYVSGYFCKKIEFTNGE